MTVYPSKLQEEKNDNTKLAFKKLEWYKKSYDTKVWIYQNSVGSEDKIGAITETEMIN